MVSPPTPTVPLDDAQTPADAPRAAATALDPGTRIGRYLVVEKIGEGGAGAVYAAFDAKLDRKVALKLLQRGSGGPLSTRDPRWPKLVQEARMLAKLSEPEVVTVFDVGEHDGVGYLAMELVRGGDLAAWIRRHRGPQAPEPAGIAEALALMLQAGEGLACAHRAGLVHGDFKPANVLIDAKGRAKVSDFGIARLRASEHPPALVRTEPSELDSASADGAMTADFEHGPRWIGTPAFMAPEQFDGVAPSQRTDVYAFCTALFQAAHGVLPWSGRSMLELATLKVQRPPARPAKGAVPRWLDRLLDRGLAVRPSDRLSSMDAVLAQLRRGMRSRRRAGVLAAGSALATAGVGVALWAGAAADPSLCETRGFDWSETTADRVRAAFEAAGHHAPREAWSRVDARLSALDGAWTDTWDRACRASDSPSLQQRSLDCLERQRRQARALVDAWSTAQQGGELVDRAARAAAALADPASCLEPEALSMGDRVPDDPELAGAVDDVRAEIDRAVGLSRAGRTTEALDQAEAAMKAAEETAFSPVIAEASLVLGRARSRAGTTEEAVAALERAYFEADKSDAHAVVAEAATRLVWVGGVQLERHAQAQLWAQHAAAALDKTGGRRDQLQSNIGGLQETMGEYEAAVATLEQALEQVPDGELYDEGVVHQRLGNALRRQGKSTAATEHYARTVDLYTRALGPSHPNVAMAKVSWATGLDSSGHASQAEPIYRDAIAALRTAMGPTHPSVSATLHNLGLSLKNQRRLDEAAQVLREAVEIDAEGFGPDHLKTADHRETLGRVLTRLGRADEALVEHAAAGSIYVAQLPAGHPWIILNHLNRGDALRALERFEDARRAYAAGHESAQAHRDVGDPLRSDAATYYGRALLEAGLPTEALAVLEPAQVRLKTQEGYEDVLAACGWALARARVQTGGDEQAAVALAKASRRGLAGWPQEQAALDAWVAARE